MNSPFFLIPRIAGGKSGPSTRLKIGDLMIGRDKASDIYLPDPTVSRRHAMLSVAASGLVLTDLHSRGGTWINSQRIRCAKVPLGTVIKVGQISFVIVLDPNEEHGISSGLETTDPRPVASVPLTPRQKEVLHWLVQGYQQKEVAAKLNISPETVHNHIRAIYTAFDVHSVVELLLKVLPPS